MPILAVASRAGALANAVSLSSPAGSTRAAMTKPLISRAAAGPVLRCGRRMHSDTWNDPALTIALALAAGMIAHTLARHLKVPGIVLLLATGVLLGPDVLDVVRPAVLGASLHDLVGFAVAVILFEGGMNLNLERLRREARSIRQLVTLGALVTAAGAALAARWIMDWSWTASILFGTLVMVTGPTVITPLLRRIKVKTRVATVLEAEGVLVDAIGAIVAVVALEIAIGPPGGSVAFGAWQSCRASSSAPCSAPPGGFAIAALLRFQRAIPEGLESVFTLSFVLLLYQGSNAILPETGIVTAVAAGLVVGNARAHVVAELREFKEQLSVMLIGLLFVLLAADVQDEGRRGAGLGGGRAGRRPDVRGAAAQRARRHLGDRPHVAREGVPLLARAARHRGRRGLVAVRRDPGGGGHRGRHRAAGHGLPGHRRHGARPGPFGRAGGESPGPAAPLEPGLRDPRRQPAGPRPRPRARRGRRGGRADRLQPAGLPPRPRRRASGPSTAAALDRGVQETGGARHPRGVPRRHHQRGGQPPLRPPGEEGLQGAPGLGGAAPRPSRHRREAVHRFGGHILFGEPQEVDLWMLRLEQGRRDGRELGATTARSHLRPGRPGPRPAPACLWPSAAAGRLCRSTRSWSFQKGDLLVLAVAHEGRAEVLKFLGGRGWSPAVPGDSP